MNPKKILIIKLRHHGDVLLTTPLFRVCRDAFPQVQVDALVYQETCPLLENNPDLHHVYAIDRTTKGIKRLRHEWALLQRIRKTQYEVIIHLTDQWIGAMIARFSGATYRIHLSPIKRKHPFWLNSFTHAVQPPPRGQLHAIELNLLSLKVLGIHLESVSPQVVLRPNPVAFNKAVALLHEKHIQPGFILVHPAARWPFKCWSDAKFGTIISGLLNRGLTVVLTSSPSQFEQEMTNHIEQLALQNTNGQGKLVNYAGLTDLPTLAALQLQCRFYMGVDSAPMHMAAALNVPQIALFGPSWLNEWRPWSTQAITIYAGDYGPLPHPDQINTNDTTRLLDAIPISVVEEHVSKMLRQTA